MNYSELLQLAKGWGNFVSDRINIWRLPYTYNEGEETEVHRMREKTFHVYVDSHDRSLLLQSLVELKMSIPDDSEPSFRKHSTVIPL